MFILADGARLITRLIQYAGFFEARSDSRAPIGTLLAASKRFVTGHDFQSCCSSRPRAAMAMKTKGLTLCFRGAPKDGDWMGL